MRCQGSFTYILEDLCELLRVEIRRSAMKGPRLILIGIDGVNRNDDARSLFTAADDLSRVSGAKGDRTREVKASEGLEDTGLSCTLITDDHHLSRAES